MCVNSACSVRFECDRCSNTHVYNILGRINYYCSGVSQDTTTFFSCIFIAINTIRVKWVHFSGPPCTSDICLLLLCLSVP